MVSKIVAVCCILIGIFLVFFPYVHNSIFYLVKTSTVTMTIVKVYDGDTYVAKTDINQSDLVAYRIRLAETDCPELKQDGGKEAKDYVASLILNKQVEVEPLNRDQYGRLISKVSIKGKQLSNLTIGNGYCWHYDYFSKNKELADLQEKAKNSKLGIWKVNPVAPWDYRRNKKK